RGEGFEIAGVGFDGVRRVVALFFEEGDELGNLVHAITPMPIDPTNSRMLASARSANTSFFLNLSFGPFSSGSISPKFAFIGWKRLGSVSRRLRYNAPSIVAVGGSISSSPPSTRA